MVNFTEFLIESRGMGEVRQAKKLLKDADSDIRRALESWELINWVDGDLSKTFSNNGDISKQIYELGKPLREYIRKREGKTITLYRGLVKSGMNAQRHSNRSLFSWTARPDIAALFADLAVMDRQGKIVMHKDRGISKLFDNLSNKDLKDAQTKVEKYGRALVGSFRITVSKDNPDYANIYLRKGSRFSFYSDEEIKRISEFLMRRKKEEEEHNRDIRQRAPDGIVVKKEIPVDDIIWVLNAGGSMEYVVRGHSGSNGKEI